MAPAEVVSIVIDEDTHSMEVAVAEDNLAQAIGRGGQNVRLASELTGWELNVMTESEAEEKQEQEAQRLVNHFIRFLEADEELAQVLVEEGFTTLEEIAYVPRDEMLAIEGFDEDLVEELRERARNGMLNEALASDVEGAAAATSRSRTCWRWMVWTPSWRARWRARGSAVWKTWRNSRSMSCSTLKAWMKTVPVS